ncbi:MAG: bacteriochlorophyll 4-vinyl reductase [Pseudomonadota bacterium]
MAGVAHLVGPNAIIQTLAAAGERVMDGGVCEIVRAAHLVTPDDGWRDMVPVGNVNALNRAVLKQFGEVEAAAIMRDAGRRTGRYILENRIPKLAQFALHLMPRRVAVRLLLTAIAKNAWTFAGHAKVEVGADWIAIHNNPVCLGRSGYRGCLWHEAVFETLFASIIGERAYVRETHCIGRGDTFCRFEISFS